MKAILDRHPLLHWRGTESKLLEVQCEVSEVRDDLGCRPVTSAGVGPLCFIKSKVNAAVYQEILEHFMLPSADKLYGDFLFQQDFSTCPQCQNHFQVLCWPWYYCAWLASQHAWPEPHMGSMGYFQEKDEKQSIQQSRRAEGSIVPRYSNFLRCTCGRGWSNVHRSRFNLSQDQGWN